MTRVRDALALAAWLARCLFDVARWHPDARPIKHH